MKGLKAELGREKEREDIIEKTSQDIGWRDSKKIGHGRSNNGRVSRFQNWDNGRKLPEFGNDVVDDRQVKDVRITWELKCFNVLF